MSGSAAMRKCVILWCLLLIGEVVLAQSDSLCISYSWNEDSTITFTYLNSTARKVVLIGNCMLPKEDLSFAGRQMRRTMHETRPGVWECSTLRRLTPELYTTGESRIRYFYCRGWCTLSYDGVSSL